MTINGLNFDAFSEIIREIFCGACLFDRALIEYWRAGHDVFVSSNLISMGMPA